MNKRTTSLSIAAVLAASAFVLQSPLATAQSDTRGVPGVEANVGDNASDRGLPGVEMNIGRDGDQNNVDANIGRPGDQNNIDLANPDTRTLGAGADAGSGTTTEMGADGPAVRPMQMDRG